MITPANGAASSARLLLLLFAAGLALSSVAGAQPTENPIEAMYPGQYPWSDEIAWQNVVSIADYEAETVEVTDNRGQTRTNYLPAIVAAQDALVAGGGGVVYFPPGTYYVAGDLELEDGVVLRGAAPADVTDARTEGFAPPSVLEFPEYVPTFTGQGTPVETAFKELTASGVSNAGLVNLYVNRAEIGLSNSGRNVVVLGVRSNNAATPGFSSAYEQPESWMEPWQRFPYRFSTNVSASASENLLIANSRLNDDPTDNFEQEGYMVEWRGQTGDTFPNDAKVALGIDIGPPFVFDYTAHYAVQASAGSGLVIRDNWIYGTRRVKINFSGDGAVVKGNVLRDDVDKFAWVGATGKRTAWGGETLENRGIDLAGYDVLIEDNDIEVYSHETYSGHKTTDGEGILIQEVGGNPVARGVDGLIIRGNTVNQYIGIYKVGNINDLLIENNTIDSDAAKAGGTVIYVNADRNNDPNYSASNVRIVGNSVTAGDILLQAGQGGPGNEVSGNRTTGSDSEIHLRGPDADDRPALFVQVTDNTGFTVVETGQVRAAGEAGNFPPTVSLDADPTFGSAPLTVTFTAEAQDVDGEVVSYAWDFGDGTETTGSEATVTHEYTEEGSFDATVTATDDGDATAVASVRIFIGTPGSEPVRINFQPADHADTPDGYMVDAGAVFGDRGNGQVYGWDSENLETRARGTHSDERYDTINHLSKSGDRTWEIAVAEGQYEVFLVAGDPSYTDQINTIDIEGTVVDDPDGADNFDEFLETVSVTDGRLTIAPAPGSSNAKVAFVHVTPVGGTAADDAAALPDAFALRGVYPNPFQTRANVVLDLPEPATLALQMYDVLGREVLTTPATAFVAGAGQKLTLNAAGLADGTYFYRVVARSGDRTRTLYGSVTLAR